MKQPLLKRINYGAFSFLLMIFAFPLFFVAKWLLAPGIIGGSLDACVPQLPWLKFLVGFATIAVYAGFFVFAIAGIATGNGRGFGIAALAIFVGTLPIQLIILFVFTYGDPGIGGPYCPFWDY